LIGEDCTDPGANTSHAAGDKHDAAGEPEI
jgi:hypothetical protein